MFGYFLLLTPIIPTTIDNTIFSSDLICAKDETIYKDGKLLEKVVHFKYLGSHLSSDNALKNEIRGRFMTTWSHTLQVENLLYI